MSNDVLLGVQPGGAGPYVNPWPGVRMTWTGPDGDTWALTDTDGPVVLGPDVRGLTSPAWQRFTTRNANGHGSRWRGVRADERTVHWPVAVVADRGSQEWLDRFEAFMDSLDPRRPGVWTIIHPDGTRRLLTCRFTEDSGDFEHDPSRIGLGAFGISLVAEDPFWRGPIINRSWKKDPGLSFFGAGGPPFRIGPASVTATASITNPGHEEGYPLWLVHGPHPAGVLIGVGDKIITLTGAVAAGQTVVVDTRPSRLRAVQVTTPPAGLTPEALLAYLADAPATDITRTGLAPTTRWGAIPSGRSVTLTVTTDGAGLVQVLLEPLYHRGL